MEKRNAALTQIDQVLERSKVTVHRIQRLTGLLNFLCRAVVPGRTYLRRLYDKIAGLKQYHHVRVDSELRADCKLWLEFLTEPLNVSRPFLDFIPSKGAEVLVMASDASLNKKLGIGGHFTRMVGSSNSPQVNTSWFSQRWPLGFIDKSGISIEVGELLGACMAVVIWIEELKGRRVVIWCDNQAVVQMINNSSSSCGKCMYLLRYLTLTCMTHSCRIFCKYVSTKSNWRADLLSRLRIRAFKDGMKNQEGGSVDEFRTPLKRDLWPPPEPLW